MNFKKDHNTGLGLVLPCLVSVKIRLQRVQDQGLIFCKKLIETIFNGLEKRFSHLFKNEFYILSAISTPCLKTNWIFDNEDRQEATELLKKEVKKVQKLQSKNSPLPIVDTANNSFFDVFERNEAVNFNEADVDQFLVSNDRSITLLDRFPAIRQIYKKYNTILAILASSASSERP